MRILITGGTNGMGRGVARVLAEEGHEVVILGRSQERCRATVHEIVEQTGNEAVSFVVCDLSRLDEVRGVIVELSERFESLDALFVNAGLGYAPARTKTEDGLDPHFQVNYLAHFMLTLGLLPLLQTGGGRVIVNATDFGELDLDDLQMDQGWGYERGVGIGMVAKRMFLLHLHMLTRRAGDERVSFVGFQIHKTVWTNQLNIIPWYMRLMASFASLFGSFISSEACGRIMAPLFTEDQATSSSRSGQLWTFKDGAFAQVPHTLAVLDVENRVRLWQISVALCDDESTARRAARLTDGDIWRARGATSVG